MTRVAQSARTASGIALGAALLLAPVGLAHASTGDGGIGVEVEITPRPTPLPTQDPDPDPGAGPDQLTPTGGEVPWGLVALGAGALGAGVVIVRARRRAAPADPMRTTSPEDLS